MPLNPHNNIRVFVFSDNSHNNNDMTCNIISSHFCFPYPHPHPRNSHPYYGSAEDNPLWMATTYSQGEKSSEGDDKDSLHLCIPVSLVLLFR